MVNNRTFGKDSWTLETSFRAGGHTKIPFTAQIGDSIGQWKILGFWTNEAGFLKSVKVQCSCGKVREYMGADTLKAGTSTRCNSCSVKDQTNRNGTDSANPVLKYFYGAYSVKAGNTLWALYGKRYEEHTSPSFPNGIPFEEAWKINYKAFAEYIVALLDFDKWPQYQLDRIDNNKGYIEGNLRFVLPKVNARNKTGIRILVFNDTEYYYADFVKLITGVDHCKSVYRFLQHRIVPKIHTPNQALRALYDDHTIWPDESTEKHFCKWYESQFQAKPRKGITDV